MTDRDLSPYQKALAQVDAFSETDVAVLPSKPSMEMMRYIASLTGEDPEKLARLYAYFVSVGRLDGYVQLPPSDVSGFAEE